MRIKLGFFASKPAALSFEGHCGSRKSAATVLRVHFVGTSFGMRFSLYAKASAPSTSYTMVAASTGMRHARASRPAARSGEYCRVSTRPSMPGQRTLCATRCSR